MLASITAFEMLQLHYPESFTFIMVRIISPSLNGIGTRFNGIKIMLGRVESGSCKTCNKRANEVIVQSTCNVTRSLDLAIASIVFNCAALWIALYPFTVQAVKAELI